MNAQRRNEIFDMLGKLPKRELNTHDDLADVIKIAEKINIFMEANNKTKRSTP